MTVEHAVRRCRAARVSATAAAVLLAASMVAACSSSTGGEPPKTHASELVVTAPTVSATRSATSSNLIAGLALPIQAYMPSAAEKDMTQMAIDELAEQCATGFGFNYTAPHRTSHADYNQLRRGYGAVDLATAQKYGYHPSPGDPNYQTPGHLNPHDPGYKGPAPTQLPAAEQLVLYGRDGGAGSDSTAADSYHGRSIPAGGCYGQADRKVYGAKQIDPNSVADVILVQMGKKAQTDRRVKAGFRKWSACMRQSGYRYSSPLAAAGDRKWDMNPGTRPTPAEIQTAVADVKCKQQTNLVGIWFSVESSYEKEAIQQELPQLTTVLNQWKAAAKRAAQLLGQPAPNPTPHPS